MSAYTEYIRMDRPPPNRTPSPPSSLHEKDRVVAISKSSNEATSPPHSSNSSPKADDADVAMSSEDTPSYSRALVVSSALEAHISPK